MPSTPRLGRFELQLKLALVLLVVLLAVLDLVNLVLLSRAAASLSRAERDRAVSRGRDLVLTMGPSSLLPSGAEPGPGAWTEPELRRLTSRFDLERIAILDRAGVEIAASGPGDPARTWDALDADALAALVSGRALAFDGAPGDPLARRVVALVPILDPSGSLARVVEISVAAPELGWVERNLRLLVVVQVSAVVLVALLVMLFARWVSRPYRAIVAAAGDAGLTPRDPAATTGPGELAAAFRRVAAKLQEQQVTLDALGREGGGLGELVRFAGGPAREMATGVVVLDRKAKPVAMNPAAGRLLGAIRGEGAFEAPGMEELLQLVTSCLEQRRSAAREVVEIRRADRSTVHLGVTVSPASGYHEREAAGALVLMTDLTEIRGLQDQARVRENLAAVGQLSAGIAHEFRNALGTILGWARMLEKRDDPRVRGPAQEILKEITTVREAIDEFLLYARPPAPQRMPVDVGALVQSCAAAAPVGVRIEVLGEFGTVLADAGLLRRVFGNLLQNAADAGAEDERPITVRITGRRTGSGRHVQIDVDDDGPGIPADRRGQVFVPFFTTRGRGTGLGLALVQRTVVDLGGTIEVVDGSRGGACFRVRLPLAPTGDPEEHLVSGSRHES